MALSSSLVAMGFLSGSREALVPFAATVLPAIFLLGPFTVVRLVDTGLESMHYLTGIARIRAVYRTLGGDSERHFAPEYGRWPEARTPAKRLGSVLAFMGTTASMIAVINNLVAGTVVALTSARQTLSEGDRAAYATLLPEFAAQFRTEDFRNACAH